MQTAGNTGSNAPIPESELRVAARHGAVLWGMHHLSITAVTSLSVIIIQSDNILI